MRRIALLFLLLSSAFTKADTLDSLYLSIRHNVKGNLKQVNQLMTQLDAQGWADTLVTFTANDKQEKIEATLALYMAYSCYDRGMYVMSDELARKVMTLSETLKDTEMKSDAISHLATTLFREGNLEEAIKQTIVGLHIDSLLHDPVRLSSSYNNIAAFCQAAGHHEEAEQYILKSIRIEESLKTPTKLAIRYGIASEIYTSLRQYEKALNYITQAYELDRKDGKKVGAARRQSQMGDIYLAMNDYKTAERLYKSALQTLSEEKEPTSLVITLKQISKIYSEQGEWDKCLDVLLRSDSLLRKMGGNYQLMQIVKLEAEAYKHKERWKEAAQCSEEALRLTQEVQNEKLSELTAEYTSRFNWMELEKDQLGRSKGTSGRLKNIFLTILGMLSSCLAVAICIVQRKRKAADKALAEALEAIAAEKETSKEEDENETDKPTATIAMIYENLKNLSPNDSDVYYHFRRIVMENLETVEPDLIMKKLNLRPKALESFTKRVSGMPPKSLIQIHKMEHAANELVTTNRTVTDIAMECGYYDNSYFGRVFTRIYGTSPGTYRKQAQSGNN